jgi:hypothetical protein
VDRAQFDAAVTLEGIGNGGLFAQPTPRRAQYPLDLDVIDFGGDDGP